MATYTNTKDLLGVQNTLDELVAHTLTEFTDTDVKSLRERALAVNSQMAEITLPNLESMGRYPFAGCPLLAKIHIGLEKETVCSISVDAKTYIAPVSRYIFFVPPSLVDAYRSHTYWSSIADRIYGEGDTSAPFWDETEITDSVAEISAKVANGTAATSYKLGQYKFIDLGALGVHKFQIIAINADELADGTGYAQLTWYPMTLMPEQRKIDNDGSWGGDWELCTMRTYLLETVWPLIPSEWREMIKSVKKYTAISNDQKNKQTSETLWLPSFREVCSSMGSGYETLGPAYDFAFPGDAFRRRAVPGASSNSTWWLRTSGDGSGKYVNGNGNTVYSVSYSTATANFIFGFCT